MPVDLPKDLMDDFFIHTLSVGNVQEKSAVESMSVRDAILWRHMKRYAAYLDQEYIKSLKR